MKAVEHDWDLLVREARRHLIARCYVALAEVDYELRAWAAEVAR